MLTVYTLEQSGQWDGIVRSFEKYDTYWLSGYVRAFRIHGDGEPLLFYYEGDSARGINVVMRRDVARDPHFLQVLPEGQYYDFSTPYGYGGWLIEGGSTSELFAAYEDWCCQNGIISEFVRFHPVVKNHEKANPFYRIVPLGEVVRIDLHSETEIWENFSAKNRNVIRKAVKNGVSIHRGRDSEIYETFRGIYNATMEKDNAAPYYFFEPPFYTSLLEDLPENAQVFYAQKDGVVIAASIMLTANGMMNYHLSGSLREYSSLAATNLLLYQAALWGLENGCRSLYLGGGVGSGEDGLFKFKRAFFRGPLERFHIGKRVFDRDRYEELLRIRGIESASFFPEYRG